jgi:hypothetical protein
MTELISSAAANAAVSAFYETIIRLTEYVPGAYERQGAAGTRLLYTTFPVPELNAVCVDHERDLGEVEAFAREMSATGMPWSIQVRGEAGPELTELAARYGRTAASTQPLLLWDAESLSALPTAVPHGATVRKVPGTEAKVFATALSAGFGMPKDVANVMSPPALFDAPGMTGFVLDVHGEAVATGFNVMVGDHVGMYNGSVPPWHRGNGYYRALVTARLADAVACGARHAFALNSPMSRPLYESLGFRLAETWTYLTSV